MKANPVAIMLWLFVGLLAFGITGSLQVAALWAAGAVAVSLFITLCMAVAGAL